MLDENELLFDELYEKTKDCGRVQFVRLLMEKEREIKKLEEEYQIIDSKLFFTKYELDMRQKSIDNKLSQQKEFIEYLEDRIKFWKDKIFENSLTEDNFTLALWRSRLITYEEVLNKIEKR